MKHHNTHLEEICGIETEANLFCFLNNAFILAITISISCFLFSGCSTTQIMPEDTFRDVTKADILYLNYIQFDYIYRNTPHNELPCLLFQDSIECFKRNVLKDSNPYEVKVVILKEIPQKHNWLDVAAYSWMIVSIAAIGFWLYKQTL